jgi:hypothetical protein
MTDFNKSGTPTTEQLLSCFDEAGYKVGRTEWEVLANAMLLALERFGAAKSSDRDIRIAEAVRNECLSLLHGDDPAHYIRRLDLDGLISRVVPHVSAKN